MEPKFQTSFIPKRPVGEGGVVPAATANIFSVLATIIFVLTLLICGGLFAWNRLLVSQVAQAKKDLGAAEAAFQPETIQEIITAESRIKSAQELLNKHLVVSQILNLLSEATVRSIRFTNLSFVYKTKTPTIFVNGEVLSYASLAEQSRTLTQNPALSGISYSDFGLSDQGTVTFKMNANVDPNLISYKRQMEVVQ